MSGQPNIYPSDLKAFRQDYMNSLNLRANIDKMNLEANNTYKQTGQLPAMSQMADNRTTTEILGDVVKLKSDLIVDLAPIASPQLAQMVIERIEKHPLNVDGGFFTFVTQRMPDVVTQLKKIYKYKIKGDSNDADTLVQYLADYYNKAKSTLGGFKTFINRPSTTSAGLKIEDINSLIKVFDELRAKIYLRYTNQYQRIIDRIAAKLANINDFLSDPITKHIIMGYPVNPFTSYPGNAQLGYPPGPLHDVPSGPTAFHNRGAIIDYNEINRILKALPDEASILTLYDRLDRSIINENPDLTGQILSTIDNLIPRL